MSEQKTVNTTGGAVQVTTPAVMTAGLKAGGPQKTAADKKAVRVVEKAAVPTGIMTDAPAKTSVPKKEIIPASLKNEVRFVIVNAPVDSLNEKDTTIWFGYNGRLYHFNRNENVEMPFVLYHNCIANSDLKDKVQIISRFTKEVREKKKAK